MAHILRAIVLLAGLFATFAALGILGIAFLLFSGTFSGESVNQIGNAVFVLLMPCIGFGIVAALISPAVWVLHRVGGVHA